MQYDYPNREDGSATEPLIPDVAGLTRICKTDAETLGEKFVEAWAAIEEQCKAARQNPNIENILSRLRMMIGAIGVCDTLAGLKEIELVKLEAAVRRKIAEIVNPDSTRIPDGLPHRKFAQWLAKTARKHPVEIFTVNYDILIEFALEAERIPIFDGFVGSYQPFFHPDSLRPRGNGPRGGLDSTMEDARLCDMAPGRAERSLSRDPRCP